MVWGGKHLCAVVPADEKLLEFLLASKCAQVRGLGRIQPELPWGHGAGTLTRCVSVGR